ncbi:hypothetical protein CcrSwift_gp311 [Caulobacter phage CcrSwift]|uniref:Uncharacterized protein n=1 Tax=Caulobacter phage CcrSwift TaxID=2927984 RepID=K4JTE0_9CAUD|nr:hypothetical protein D870_gp110 [Caulobacter phage CcrSwift]AFU88629.1 hypothetical protein CcrSwift_gp311 [Caulobacter phage CcrSwift]
MTPHEKAMTKSVMRICDDIRMVGGGTGEAIVLWKFVYRPAIKPGRAGRYALVTAKLDVPLPMRVTRGYRRCEMEAVVDVGYAGLRPVAWDETGRVLEYRGRA